MILCSQCGTINKDQSKVCIYCKKSFVKKVPPKKTSVVVNQLKAYYNRPGTPLKLAKLGMYMTAMAFIGYLFIAKNALVGDAIYDRAEKFYNKARYSEALTCFEKYVQKCPDADLVPLAQQKIANLSYKLLATARERKENLKKIPNLLKKAHAAMNRQQLLHPVEDNVMNYVWQVLSIDPENSDAATIKEAVIYHLKEEALKYRMAKDIFGTIRAYKKLMMVDPENTNIFRDFQKVAASVEKPN